MTLTRRAFTQLLGLAALLPAWMVGRSKSAPFPSLPPGSAAYFFPTELDAVDFSAKRIIPQNPEPVTIDGKQYYVGVVHPNWAKLLKGEG